MQTDKAAAVKRSRSPAAQELEDAANAKRAKLEGTPMQDREEMKVVQILRDKPGMTAQELTWITTLPGFLAIFEDEHLPGQLCFIKFETAEKANDFFQSRTQIRGFYLKFVPQPSLMKLLSPLHVAKSPSSTGRQPQSQHSGLPQFPAATRLPPSAQSGSAPMQHSSNSNGYSGQSGSSFVPLAANAYQPNRSQLPGQQPLFSESNNNYSGIARSTPQLGSVQSQTQSGQRQTTPAAQRLATAPPQRTRPVQQTQFRPQPAQPRDPPEWNNVYPCEAVVQYPLKCNAVQQLRQLGMIPPDKMYSYKILRDEGNAVRIRFSSPEWVKVLMKYQPNKEKFPGINFYCDNLDKWMPLLPPVQGQQPAQPVPHPQQPPQTPQPQFNYESDTVLEPELTDGASAELNSVDAESGTQDAPIMVGLP